MASASHAISTLTTRRAGVLLHPTSLPGGEELGVLGPDAFHFIDFLCAAGINVWQVLPLGPTHGDLSPYMSMSVHAGNPYLISFKRLEEWGWLTPEDARLETRHHRLLAAHEGFEREASAEDREDFRNFVAANESWLEDYVLYQALRERHHGAHWSEWPAPLRDGEAKALKKARAESATTLEHIRFEQYVFFRQWLDIKHYANERGIELFGDMPIFVAHDSAEVWANRELFDLDENGNSLTVAGVPPDYFSKTGQLWGNPHYRWDRMAEDGYRWWIDRLRTSLSLFDRVRIDHFRGFEAYWQIDAQAETAVDGVWVKGPGDDFFAAITHALPHLPLVAEDLGIITPEVETLRDRWGLPGMKILQFAFDGGSDNLYLPHNHIHNAVVYTGTHDNDTTFGWYQQLPQDKQTYIREYLATHDDMPWALIRSALASTARLAVIPMQDLLGLGSEARMNTPSITEGNWRWRFQWTQVTPELAPRLARLCRLYGRVG